MPDIYGIVKRTLRVSIKAMDENGRNVEYHVRGLAARAICHEIDHLEGILFLDKAEPGTLKNITMKE